MKNSTVCWIMVLDSLVAFLNVFCFLMYVSCCHYRSVDVSVRVQRQVEQVVICCQDGQLVRATPSRTWALATERTG